MSDNWEDLIYPIMKITVINLKIYDEHTHEQIKFPYHIFVVKFLVIVNF